MTFAFMAISLLDLSAGISLLTGFPEWQAWLLAIGIDALYCAVEYRMLTQEHDAESGWVATIMIGVTAVMSSALNVVAFTAHAAYPIAAGCAGATIPLLILGATHLIARTK